MYLALLIAFPASLWAKEKVLSGSEVIQSKKQELVKHISTGMLVMILRDRKEWGKDILNPKFNSFNEAKTAYSKELNQINKNLSDYYDKKFKAQFSKNDTLELEEALGRGSVQKFEQLNKSFSHRDPYFITLKDYYISKKK